MPPGGFKSAIPASERPQTLALDRAALGIDVILNTILNKHAVLARGKEVQDCSRLKNCHVNPYPANVEKRVS
jgi:hypothetical protein